MKAVMTEQPYNEATDTVTFGFWVYLMTDCVLFASLFAVYAVLRGNTFGGPNGGHLFSLGYVLAETLILLTSSFTAGLATIAVRRRNRAGVFGLLGITGALGAAFLYLEISEFQRLITDGNSWHRSGFLSSFFTLVGTHGIHITIGLLWLVVLLYQLLRKGFRPMIVRRLALFSMFWHFLDLIWIFIFTVVYLMGVAQR